jgi:DNA-binding MarR family transcriptional regulator
MTAGLNVNRIVEMVKAASRGGRHPRQGKVTEPVSDAAFEQWPDGVDFGVLSDLIGYALRRAQIAIYQEVFATVGTLGVTPQLFAALVLIEKNPGLNQSRLGRVMGVNRAAAMALIDRLEDLGFVTRIASETDRRSNAVVVTKTGQTRLSKLVHAVRAHDARVSERLTAAELVALRNLLRKF